MLLPIQAVVNGQLTNLGDRLVLHVWGTHYERGYATGYLVGDRIMTVFTQYFYSNVAGNSLYMYNQGLTYFNDHFSTDVRYVSEAQGVLQGMIDAGVSIWHSGLGRDLNLNDLLFTNSIVDLSGGMKEGDLGCSSLSSWGSASADDPLLAGSIQITRLLDWSRNPALIANAIVTIHHPSEPDEQKWLSFGYPGLYGALSAISETKCGAFLNMGNIHPSQDTNNLTNVLFDIRSGIERLDFNGDLYHDTYDIFTSVAIGNHRSGTIVHSIKQYADSTQAMIIETNNSGTVKRHKGESSAIQGDNLAATNHFRLLAEPTYCSRYLEIIDSLDVSPFVSNSRQWQLMQGAGGVSGTMMMIQYLPNVNLIRWSVANSQYPAWSQPYMEFDTNVLFSQPTSNSDNVELVNIPRLSPIPNPLKAGQVLRFERQDSLVRIAVFNTRGQQVFEGKPSSFDSTNSLPQSGIYFMKGTTRDGIVQTGKLLYLK